MTRNLLTAAREFPVLQSPPVVCVGLPPLPVCTNKSFFVTSLSFIHQRITSKKPGYKLTKDRESFHLHFCQVNESLHRQHSHLQYPIHIATDHTRISSFYSFQAPARHLKGGGNLWVSAYSACWLLLTTTMQRAPPQLQGCSCCSSRHHPTALPMRSSHSPTSHQVLVIPTPTLQPSASSAGQPVEITVSQHFPYEHELDGFVMADTPTFPRVP